MLSQGVPFVSDVIKLLLNSEVAEVTMNAL
jgi:hypothetical protein